MDQVIKNLWLGDIASIADVDTLKKNNIHAILSAMRGNVVIQPVCVSRKVAQTRNPHHPRQTFTHHQIEIDDTEQEDILKHLIACISFIEAELEKAHGVLVHCQAGMSAIPPTSYLSSPVAQS